MLPSLGSFPDPAGTESAGKRPSKKLRVKTEDPEIKHCRAGTEPEASGFPCGNWEAEPISAFSRLLITARHRLPAELTLVS